MTILITIALLLTATAAQAALQTAPPEETASLRPEMMASDTGKPSELGPLTRHGCKPVLLFMRLPDGKAVLLGMLAAKDAC